MRPGRAQQLGHLGLRLATAVQRPAERRALPDGVADIEPRAARDHEPHHRQMTAEHRLVQRRGVAVVALRIIAIDRGEDKLIAQARKEGKTSLQIAQFYTEAFHEDEAKLNILPAHIFPRATQHIPEMITIIQGFGGIAHSEG